MSFHFEAASNPFSPELVKFYSDINLLLNDSFLCRCTQRAEPLVMFQKRLETHRLLLSVFCVLCQGRSCKNGGKCYDHNGTFIRHTDTRVIVVIIVSRFAARNKQFSKQF